MTRCSRKLPWFLASLAAVAVALVALPALPSAATASDGSRASRPNIVLIMAEDLGPRLGAYGDAVAHTPALDRLAGEGVRYTNAFTTSGVCAPSRAAMILGVHQNSWGAGHMRAPEGGYVAVPPPDWKAFPELLRRAGYWVVNNGKTDYQMSTTLGGVFGGPSSIWDEQNGDDWRGRAPGQPFFAYLTLAGTHESQVWPTWDLSSLTKLFMAPMRIANHWRWEHRTDPNAIRLPPYYPDTPTVRADLARHYDNLAVADRDVAAILEKLEEDGVAESTLVVFMGDHGDGLPRAKRWLYDSGIRVPLIVRWPGRVPPGQVRDELVSGVDLAPTFLQVAGAEVPPHMQGRVFLGEGAHAEPPFVYAARDRMDEQADTVRAVRDRRFKYIRNLYPERPYVRPLAFRDQMPMMQEMLALHRDGLLEGDAALWFRPTRDPEELYDTEADPHELRNLAAEPAHRERLEQMRAELDRWLAASGDLGLLPEAELAERFWPGGEQPRTAPPVLERRPGGAAALSCPTPGASIELRGAEGGWMLYTRPLELPPGSGVQARAVRYGWEDSGNVALRAP